jgi:hypothetical protein
MRSSAAFHVTVIMIVSHSDGTKAVCTDRRATGVRIPCARRSFAVVISRRRAAEEGEMRPPLMALHAQPMTRDLSTWPCNGLLVEVGSPA